jgi:hypothetical protein
VAVSAGVLAAADEVPAVVTEGAGLDSWAVVALLSTEGASVCTAWVCSCAGKVEGGGATGGAGGILALTMVDRGLLAVGLGKNKTARATATPTRVIVINHPHGMEPLIFWGDIFFNALSSIFWIK